jgi:transposase-like protein
LERYLHEVDNPIMTAPRNPDPLFRRRHFEQELIILCVRWYISYKLSYRDLAEIMAERGVAVAHTTLLRWTQRYVPEFEKRWKRFARPVGCSWRMDETYIKVRARVRTCKHLNNIVEQDHRGIKSRTGPMLGFQLFTNAATAIAGIELIRRIKKGQFKLGQFAAHRKTIPQIWAAVLDA